MASSATIPTLQSGATMAGVKRTISQASDETEILDAARDGDHEAFRWLVERHQGRVHGLALRILRDPEWARDATQEAFLKAYRNLRGFEGRSAFSTWMYRLTYNHCLDLIRREKGRRHVELDDAPWVEKAALESAESQGISVPISPEDSITRAELRETIRNAIDRLPDQSRHTLLLREVEGLSYAEIAETLGIPKGTVMSRLHFARQKVRGMLEELGIRPSSHVDTDDERSSDPASTRPGSARSR